jgi:hypothetical protein
MDTNNKMSTNNRLLDDKNWKNSLSYYWQKKDGKLIYIGPPNHTFFLSRDRKTKLNGGGCKYTCGPKEYSSHSNVATFFKEYRFVPEKDSVYYESLLPHKPYPEYFDIDLYVDKNLSEKELEQIKEDALSSFYAIRDRFIEENDHISIGMELSDDCDIFILDGSRPKGDRYKISFHLIFRYGMCFRNVPEHMKKWMKKFHAYIEKSDLQFNIDTAVYSSNQQLRMIGSQKAGTGVPLNISPHFHVKDYNILDFFVSYPEPDFGLIGSVDYGDDPAEREVKKETEWRRYQKEQEEIDDEKVSVGHDELEQLVSFIRETIQDGTSSIAHPERKGHCHYDPWSRIALLIYSLSQGSDEGFKIYDKYWHSVYRKQEVTSKKRWYQLKFTDNNCKKPLTVGTLYYYARENPKFEQYRKRLLTPQQLEKTNRRYTEKLLAKAIAIVSQQNLITSREETRKYVLPKGMPDDILSCLEKFICLKANLGTGKSTYASGYLKENLDKYDSVVILSPRQSFSSNIKLKFDIIVAFTDYRDINPKNIDDIDYLVIQVESLYKISQIIKNWEKTLIIADEIESILTQLTSHKTHGDNHLINIRIFHELLTRAKKVLLMDAFLSDRTTKCLLSMGIPRKDIHVVKINTEVQMRNCSITDVTDISDKKTKCNIFHSWLDSIVQDLNEGKNIAIFSTSYNQLKNGSEYKSKNSYITKSSILKYIRNKCKRKIKICEYTSRRKDKGDPNEVWTKCNLLIYTGSITVGVDFNKRHFDRIYCYANAMSKNLTRDIAQSLYRIRHLKGEKGEDECHLSVFLDAHTFGIKGDEWSISYPEIKKQKHESIDSLQKFYHKFDAEYPLSPEWYTTLLNRNTLERNLSIRFFKPMLLQYLQMSNYKIEIIKNCEELEVAEEALIEPKTETPLLHQIKTIDAKEYKKLFEKIHKGFRVSDDDRWSMKKFRFLDRILSDELSDKVKQLAWNEFNKRGGFIKLQNARIEKRMDMEGDEMALKFFTSVQKKNLIEHANKNLMRVHETREIMGKLGIQDSGEKWKIDIDTFIKVYDSLNIERYRKMFGLRNQCKKDQNIQSKIRAVKQILTNFCPCTFKTNYTKNTPATHIIYEPTIALKNIVALYNQKSQQIAPRKIWI